VDFAASRNFLKYAELRTICCCSTCGACWLAFFDFGCGHYQAVESGYNSLQSSKPAASLSLMSKSYLLWALIGMIGYSVTATMVKLATESGRFSSYFVLMISSAMVVTTSTTITILRGDIKAFSRENLASADGMFALCAGVALVVAVVFYFLALSEGPTSIVVPIYGMFIVGGAVLGLVFLHEPFTLRKGLGIFLAAVSVYLIAGSHAPMTQPKPKAAVSVHNLSFRENDDGS
jgi:transporter family protein